MFCFLFINLFINFSLFSFILLYFLIITVRVCVNLVGGSRMYLNLLVTGCRSMVMGPIYFVNPSFDFDLDYGWFLAFPGVSFGGWQRLLFGLLC